MDEFHFFDPRTLLRPSEVFDPARERNMVKTELTGVNICQLGGDQEEKALMELNELAVLPKIAVIAKIDDVAFAASCSVPLSILPILAVMAILSIGGKSESPAQVVK